LVTRATTRWALAATGLALSLVVPGHALAHVPLARSVALAPQGTAAAVSLPGFGIAVRRDGDASFAYACDALLGIVSSDVTPPMVFTEFGGHETLLIGTDSGLRSVTADACPSDAFGGLLRQQPVLALAVLARSPNVVYAVTQRGSVRIARSDDGGLTWEMRATLPTAGPISGLVLDDADENAVYVSAAAPTSSTVFVSTDAGVSFSAVQQDAARALLALQGPSESFDGRRFWAVGRVPATASNRGFELTHAAAPEGPWTPVLTLNFFGGFAVQPDGVLWAGDEGGGVYRSPGGDATFDDVSKGTAVANLAYAQGALFGCTPGTSTQRAVARWSDAHSAFDDVVALVDVTHMVDCAPLDVARTCAAAWVEWQRDVLLLPQHVADAGAPSGGSGGTASGGGGSGGTASGGSDARDGSIEPPARASSSGGCSLTGSVVASSTRAHAPAVAGWLAAAAALVRVRLKRRR
jgi:hypothetical protein